ncbi:hypothetical protein QR680_013458 [Steinernema hermaphroditum]|uniref:RRM domain-containing protein n=1 Tax=Steinernema hermaphroditum TaxID=289476 RepID=A0AA39I5K4_9BILA|nr:hypothetical protein QR680_013458 [Steinernema hermaphroditum]
MDARHRAPNMEVDKIPQRPKRVKVPVPKVSEVLTSSNDAQNEEQEKAKKLMERMEKKTAVVKLTNFPRGFFAKQQLGYFKQFGKVKRLRMLYNKKSGRPSGIAFIEFDDPDVAEIVCESMNNYLMFEKVLKAKQLRRKDLPKSLLRKGGSRLLPPPRRYATSRRHSRLANAEKSDKNVKKAQETLKKKLTKKNEEFEKAGINYKFNFGAKKTETADSD